MTKTVRTQYVNLERRSAAEIRAIPSHADAIASALV